MLVESDAGTLLQMLQQPGCSVVHALSGMAGRLDVELLRQRQVAFVTLHVRRPRHQVCRLLQRGGGYAIGERWRRGERKRKPE